MDNAVVQIPQSWLLRPVSGSAVGTVGPLGCPSSANPTMAVGTVGPLAWPSSANPTMAVGTVGPLAWPSSAPPQWRWEPSGHWRGPPPEPHSDHQCEEPGQARALRIGGGGGIRTHGGVAPTHAFEACSFGRSDTPPQPRIRGRSLHRRSHPPPSRKPTTEQLTC